MLLGKRLRHGGNPVLRWMASNIAVVQDAAGNLKPAKDKSSERIDGIVALIMAIGRAVSGQATPEPQYQCFSSEETESSEPASRTRTHGSGYL